MHMRIFPRLCAAALAAGAFLTSAPAQLQVFGGVDKERRSSTVIMFDRSSPGAMAGASISFSAPQWKPEYDDFDAMLDKYKMKGNNLRLGKNWWTSLDTTMALEIAGTKVDAGAYHVGLHCDKDGNFHLLLLDAGESAKNGWVPFGNFGAWKAAYRIPLELKKDTLEESRERMEIELTADPKNPTSGGFAIRWGKHELAAPVKFTVPAQKKSGNGAGDASGVKTEPAKER
jgi:hypothetical protein